MSVILNIGTVPSASFAGINTSRFFERVYAFLNNSKIVAPGGYRMAIHNPSNGEPTLVVAFETPLTLPLMEVVLSDLSLRMHQEAIAFQYNGTLCTAGPYSDRWTPDPRKFLMLDGNTAAVSVAGMRSTLDSLDEKLDDLEEKLDAWRASHDGGGSLDRAQRAAIAGGVQEHSVGGRYPYSPVAVETDKGLCWIIQNMQDGTVAVDKAGYGPISTKPPYRARGWKTCREALAWFDRQSSIEPSWLPLA